MKTITTLLGATALTLGLASVASAQTTGGVGAALGGLSPGAGLAGAAALVTVAIAVAEEGTTTTTTTR